jgi:hypothetical protein
MIATVMPRCRARWTRAFFPLLSIVACSALPLRAQQQPEPSTIAVPIRLDLASLSPEIEKRVEKTFDGTAKERGIDIEYKVARDPIRIGMIGGGLHSSTTIKYAMQACRGRFPCMSCGFAQPRREAQVTLHTKLEWDPAWRLRSHTVLLPVSYPKPCEVTWFGIDITRRFVAPVVEQQLGIAAKIIDRNAPAMTNIKPQAEQIWTALQTPYELAPRTWLVMDPVDVALTPIAGAKSIAASTLSLRTQTRVVVGEKPATTRKPLPPLRVAASPATSGVRVPFDLELPYDEASRLATRDYAGKTYKVDGRELKLESLKVGPSFNGRISIEAMIDYRGGMLRNYRGLIFLEGTPAFDPATSSIVVADLDYALDPAKRRGFFSRVLEKAAHVAIRQRLRESARFTVGDKITEVRAELTRALNRQLAKGVTLRGRADAIVPQRVTSNERMISMHVIATGAAEVLLR